MPFLFTNDSLFALKSADNATFLTCIDYVYIVSVFS